MRAVTRRFIFGGLMLALAGCGSKFRSYKGPAVTRIYVLKKQRIMYLMHNRQVLKAYRIGLGFAPVGDKKIEGDGKTPEGWYRIDRRNPESDFHLSLGINYPSANDIAEARKLGQSPGGDIFIHGRGNLVDALVRDWTWGCIAVTNDEMEEVYAMVRTGTPILIQG